jgi:hypothetical protein
VKGRVCLIVCLFELAAARLALPLSWKPQGPGPSLNGQTEGICSELVNCPRPKGDNPVAGAVNAIVLGATPNVLYVGAVNGGVWMTTNATSPTRQTAASPHWTR